MTSHLFKLWHQGATHLLLILCHHQVMQKIYQLQRSPWQSKYNTGQLQLSSRWQFTIDWQASSVTIQESNGQGTIDQFFHIDTWNSSHGNSITWSIIITPRFWISGSQYSLGGGGWMQACATGIHEGIQLSIWTIESARQCRYSLEAGFKWRQWTIRSMESGKSVST